MSPRDALIFLVDVDNTLLDNDGLQEDLRDHLEREFGAPRRDRFWKILIDLFAELGYRDYIGALQKLRAENPNDQRLLAVSSFLMDYPFADRLYPGALDEAELAAFASAARAAGLGVALAGSVGLRHLAALRRIGADVIGIRGAVCRGGDRRGAIDAALVKDFIARARVPAAGASPIGIPVSLEL